MTKPILVLDTNKVKDNIRALDTAMRDANAAGASIAEANAAQQAVWKGFGQPDVPVAPAGVSGPTSPGDRGVGGGMFERAGTGTGPASATGPLAAKCMSGPAPG